MTVVSADDVLLSHLVLLLVRTAVALTGGPLWVDVLLVRDLGLLLFPVVVVVDLVVPTVEKTIYTITHT